MARESPHSATCEHPYLSEAIRHLAVPIASVIADPSNVRLHGEESIRVIQASLRRFGQRKAILIDDRGVTIAGAGVLEAARGLGWTHVAAVRDSQISGPERVAFAIADNRSAEKSTWDGPALSQLLSVMDAQLREDLGFSDEDLLRLYPAEPELDEDQAPAPAPHAIAKPGELWRLGEHRLLCGDSTNAADVDRVLAGEAPALVSTDPPYMVDYTGIRMGDNGKDWSAVYREIDIPDSAAFYHALFTQVVRVMRKGAAVYCWHSHTRLIDLIAVWRDLGLLDHQQIVWAKPLPVLGRVHWSLRHEPCLMGWLKGHMPAHDGRYDVDSVWSIASDRKRLDQLTREQLIAMLQEASSLWEVPFDGGKKRSVGAEHPTQKPLEIFARPMRRHTIAGDLVFEPFSGSGSQLIAAEKLGRRCAAIEIQPVFVDVAIRRWQSLTGRDAVLDGTGETWNALAARRGPGTLEVQLADGDPAGARLGDHRVEVVDLEDQRRVSAGQADGLGDDAARAAGGGKRRRPGRATGTAAVLDKPGNPARSQRGTKPAGDRKTKPDPRRQAKTKD